MNYGLIDYSLKKHSLKKTLILIVFVLALLSYVLWTLITLAAASEIYTCIDENKEIVYTNYNGQNCKQTKVSEQGFYNYSKEYHPFLVDAKPIKTSLHGSVVSRVSDGDTVNISGSSNYTCRLYGIDAPESSQAYGREAQNYLSHLLLNQNVDVEKTGDTTYGREVCVIRKSGTNINLEMVKAGYAWAYRQYLKRPHASEYINAENEARRNKKGLWQQINPTPPWEWRSSRKSTGSKSSSSCGSKKYCSQMVSCEEAKFYWKTCGLTQLDGDGDGIPCESLCGYK